MANKRKVVIIGAGIVGLATALKVGQRLDNAEITVLERNHEVLSETSRYNSGVIHSGIHQKSNLLKSRLAPRGGQELIRFCEENDVRFRRTGMLIAAASRDLAGLTRELSSLYRLRKNSRRLNLKLHVLSRYGIEKIEPNIRALLGIYLSEVWVVDQLSLGAALLKACQNAGISIVFEANVQNIVRCRNLYEIYTKSSKSGAIKVFEGSIVVNAAGVNSDTIASAAGFPRYKIYPCRGEYYEVIGEKSSLVSNTLIYPALPPGHPVKGIHLTKTAAGRLLIGPNAKSWESKFDNFRIQTPPAEFLDGAKRFLPELTESDLKWAYSGLRAKTNPGVGEDDFVIRFEAHHPHFINLVGIESPGLTASFAIGDYVVSGFSSHGF
ncbi:MAG: FAD dependent oxidoreductase [Parcubacteria group bacterium Gr01-1014_20]|nr:MAG: FAD dependent oxidoreductase [Parcubacteria group bacterium Gr01-1014_20]